MGRIEDKEVLRIGIGTNNQMACVCIKQTSNRAICDASNLKKYKLLKILKKLKNITKNV